MTVIDRQPVAQWLRVRAVASLLSGFQSRDRLRRQLVGFHEIIAEAALEALTHP